ncbi:diguanylate cyclase (GGDEF)-like protein [Cytobacillus eiseniae]|uniref:Diguanylate cyclase (GGDEF)-like protein n=1 Tax=Cytobacillus eiseniae TaxID=762947 RepID=A0ABS4RAX8_9BACI|nr:sensor domain-containing diguanylate cyclase [Cytobacillus eiseniae]MBP2239531.1 diguanylate cyclase (GGDEF)-like protein [Cytobacillus eiseniae]
MRLSIKLLILGLLAFAMLGTYIGSVISSQIVSKKTLENNYLIENEFYAKKLADITNLHFTDMISNLKVKARDKDYLSIDPAIIYQNLYELMHSTTYYNSTWFVDRNGIVIASAPDINLEGTKANTVGVNQALATKRPTVSVPYVGIHGKLVILLSAPVFDDSGMYLGFVGGTIHLHEENSLKAILGQHPKHQSNAYVYVVDSQGTIIYHPKLNRINDNVKENKVVKELIKGNSGSQELINSKGQKMLAGYAVAETANGWGIVSQTPKEAVTKPTWELGKQISLVMIPFIIFVFILTIILLIKIVNPIRDLAIYAQQITNNQSIPTDKIPDWYFEIKELKRTLLISIDYYQKKLHSAEWESKRDFLTGLYNRRALETLTFKSDKCAIILFDVDNFKRVNDQYGHLAGDEVLKFIAKLVSENIFESDLCFRWGGEEFLIILPEVELEQAFLVAERLRQTFESTNSPIGKPVTVSIGIGHIPDTAVHFSELLDITDQALYQAKQEGRNRIIVAARK